MTLGIETKDLRYRAGRAFEIKDLRLTVPTGALYGFLGPNGSGKTTTIRLLLGMLRPAAGTIRLLEQEVPRDLPRILARTGIVPDRPHLHRYLTVAESIAFHRTFYPSWDLAWAAELLGEFRLRAEQRLDRLSKGEMAKLMILLALCQTPDLLVLDEPTEGLDPVIRRDVLAAILEYVSRRGATVFVSSHLIHEVERFCDWIGVMDEGRLVVELPMIQFRSGIKRLRVSGVNGATLGSAPFTVLGREKQEGSLEAWVVRGWNSDMHAWFAAAGVTLREVVDLDLEEGFVELLRAWRGPRP